ncbi:hypothetical protein GBA52_022923 [Prunus armeniaca]|nr:hypothetical protein GBA52_022923 [Prunus armeniaca]
MQLGHKRDPNYTAVYHIHQLSRPFATCRTGSTVGPTPVLELPSSLQFSKRDQNLYTTRLSSQSEASTSHLPATTSSGRWLCIN